MRLIGLIPSVSGKQQRRNGMMGKIIIEENRTAITVVNRLSSPEAINERELYSIASGCLEKVIPVISEKSRKGMIIKTPRLEMISLRKYFSGMVTKKMFLDTATQIISVIKNCEKNMMNVNNLYLTLDHVFVIPLTKEIRCIYWPVVNNSNASTPVQFLKDLPYNLVYSKEQGTAYIEEYNHYFQTINIFSTNSFEKLVNELSGKSQINNHFPSEAISNTGERKQQEISGNLKSKSENISYDPIKQIPKSMPVNAGGFCTVCGRQIQTNASFCVSCGSKIIAREVSSAFKIDTSLLGADLYSSGTTVLGLTEPDAPIVPCLIRKKTQQKVFIDKPLFHIGKDESQVDFCIPDNSAVSRKHAAIVSRDGHFYFVDRKSTNHSYINDLIIPPEEEFELCSGTRIRLANEEFLFEC